MRKQDRLQKEALRSCKFRGHDMTPFRGNDFTVTTSHCVKCLKTVWVDTKPPPNGIEISGEAVALGCESNKGKGGTIGGDGDSLSETEKKKRKQEFCRKVELLGFDSGYSLQEFSLLHEAVEIIKGEDE